MADAHSSAAADATSACAVCFRPYYWLSDTQLSLSAAFSADIGTDGKLEEQLEESSNYVSTDIEGT